MPAARPGRLAVASRVDLGDTEHLDCGRITGLTGLRVAVLAPIAWRVPPRHYGPWEQFASLLTEGLVARGVDVTLFASGDSVTSARLASVVDRGYAEDPERRAEGRRVPPHRARLRARRRVRRHPQQLRLSPADLQRARRHAGDHDDPRVLVGRGSSRPTCSTTRRPTTSRSATQTGIRASTTWRRSTTGSTPTRSRSARDAGRLPALLRPDPSRQGNRRGDRHRGRRRACRLVIAGIVQDQDYFDELVAPAARRRARLVHRSGRARTSDRSSSAAPARCST